VFLCQQKSAKRDDDQLDNLYYPNDTRLAEAVRKKSGVRREEEVGNYEHCAGDTQG
jgi:hypothetical protein